MNAIIEHAIDPPEADSQTGDHSDLPVHEVERSNRAAQAPEPDRLTPADRYLELFTAVQRTGVFDDSKTFVDCAPRSHPRAILKAYRAENQKPGFDLTAFVHRNFRVIQPSASDYHSPEGTSLRQHIDALWPVLTRHPQSHPPHASLLQLPHAYVVPGGRFGEMYYWDSYFTMIGLACSGKADMLRDMLDNFAYLIDTFGHVPNGNRTYYLSRSQPPLFAAMVDLAERQCGIDPCDYLSQLHQEHAYWMQGTDDLGPGKAYRRVVRLSDGKLLNRYWDDRDSPREESWLEDVSTAKCSERDPAIVYRDIRAACESGWDFSSRWLRESHEAAPSASPDASPGRAKTAPSLATICTTEIAPVDLNAFIYQLEVKISEVARKAGETDLAERYQRFAAMRQTAMRETMWDEEQGAFFDLDWRAERRRRALTGATAAPLFAGLCDQHMADALAATIKARLLAPGGVSTTICRSDQQWDRPNGWAPVQWMAVQGLKRHGHDDLARTIAYRWLDTVAALYEREGKLVEKYAIRDVPQDKTHGGGGGEYPLQDGFGWTNGVTCALLGEYPEHDAHEAGAHCAAPKYA